jgi:uncharacterized protein YidB (DUF937 family)
MGLLDTVIGALANAQPSQGGTGLPQGGANDLLNVLLGLVAGGSAGGGGVGAGGGLGGLVEMFQRQGMDDVIGSWISGGQNMPISGDQLGSVLGGDLLSQIAQQLGVSQGAAADQLSRTLPQVIDQLTPEGRVPEGGVGSMADVLARFR